ncbi:MAG: response regulator [Magnetococcales bacterium]|nr:response regulator [Magnetococcales bacterium]
MHSPTLLLVDDAPLTLLLLHEFLTDTNHTCYRPYQLLTAKDGFEALELLEKTPEKFDAVLMDIMMPHMSGLELLTRMRTQPILCDIPVIFLTAKISRADFTEGIKAGAYYYLSKPVDQNHLLAILRTAIDNIQIRNELKSQLKTTFHGMTLVRSLRLECRTPIDIRATAMLLAHAFPNPEQAGIGILELLFNAVEHGNLGLTYADKTRLHEQNRWEEEVLQRLDLPENIHKYAQIELERTDTEIRMVITDHGNGFDWKSYLTFDPKRITHTHGRGIAIANSTCFDHLEYLGCGNRVMVITKCQEQPP